MSKSTIPGKAFYEQFMAEIKTAYQPEKIQGESSVLRVGCTVPKSPRPH